MDDRQMRFDGKAAVVAGVQDVADDSCYIPIAFAGKGVLDPGEDTTVRI